MGAETHRNRVRQSDGLGAEWNGSLDSVRHHLRASSGGLTLLEAPPKKDEVRIAWRDGRGHIERVLEVGRGCPVCGSWNRRRSDTHGLLTSCDYVPVECTRCPPGVYFALPVAASTELRSLKELRRACGMVEEVVERPWWAKARDAARAALTEWRQP